MYPQIKFRKISHKSLVFENSNKTLKKDLAQMCLYQIALAVSTYCAQHA